MNATGACSVEEGGGKITVMFNETEEEKKELILLKKTQHFPVIMYLVLEILNA